MIIRQNKMYALVDSRRSNNVIVTCEGMLCIYPSYKDAREGATKNEKIVPVLVRIEGLPKDYRFHGGKE